MKVEEAIKSLMRCEAETHCQHYIETFRCDGCNKRKALDMAIEALSADAVEVVRCKDCKRYESDGGALMTCTLTDLIVVDECFCWWGERREP